LSVTCQCTCNPSNIAPVAYPSGTYSAQVKLYDQSFSTAAPIVSWYWLLGDTQTYTSTNTSTQIAITNASTYFSVNDTVGFLNPPTPFTGNTVYYVVSATSTYVTLSATKGGTAITATQTQSGSVLQHCSTAQNPVVTYPSVSSITNRGVLLASYDAAGNHNGYGLNIVQYPTALPKPLAVDYYKNISIFVYTPPAASTQMATVINRARTPNNNLFFTDFQCVGSINKAGTLNFTVVNIGSATANEISLISSANMRVVVVLGYSVVWSGQILRSQNGVSQIYSGSTNYQTYAVECESDIGIMKTQYVKSANIGNQIGPTGKVISTLIQPNLSTDVNWNGAIEPSIISFEGSSVTYTITSADMYDQFNTLAAQSGFDWRTRMQTYIAAASSISPGWSSASTYTFGNTITPYTTNSFQNKFVLFLSTQYNVITFAFYLGGLNNGGIQLYPGDQVRQQGGAVFGTVVSVNTTSGSWASGTAAGTITIISGQTWIQQNFDGLAAGNNCAAINSTPSSVTVNNQNGVMSWGHCSSNTTTVLTLSSVQNQGILASTGTAFAIVLEGPVLDYAWSLKTPQPQLTLLANAPTSSSSSQALNFSDNSNYKALATVVSVKGSSLSPFQGTGAGSSLVSTLYAKDAWDSTYNFFQRSSYVTQIMDGYVYSCAANTSTIYLIGQGYALLAGDTFYVYATLSNGSTQLLGPFTIASGGVSTQTQSDGTQTTGITATSIIQASYAVYKWSTFIATKTFVSDPYWLANQNYANYTAGITCYIGSVANNTRTFTSYGVDSTRGNYVAISSSGALGSTPVPAYPGTLVSMNSYSPSSPNSTSPLTYYGSILYAATVAQNITQSDLDVYATQYLVNYSYYLRKAEVTAKLVMDFATSGARGQNQTYNNRLVMEGEQICILTSANLSPGNQPFAIWPDGQYQNQWQVMSWSLDGSTMQVTCELGDYEKNTYTLMQQLTSSTNQTLT